MISVGVDISKGKSTVCIMKPGGELLLPPHDVVHTADSISNLIRQIRSFGGEARVVLESTGHYHWPMTNTLIDKGFFVACINPLQMHKFCAQSIRKAKTDKIDSIKIVQYGIANWAELNPFKPDDDTYTELRAYSRQYHQFVTHSNKAKVNLGCLLDQTMPGIQTILTDDHGGHKLTAFVLKYWHFGNVTSKSEEAFITAFCKWGAKEGWRKNAETAEKIYALSKNSIPHITQQCGYKVSYH